jgi:hypothetical protein
MGISDKGSESFISIPMKQGLVLLIWALILETSAKRTIRCYVS